MGTYAVFKTGGRQLRAAPGDTVLVDRLDAEPGEEVRFDQVLLIGGDDLKVGDPLVAGAAVVARVEAEVKGDKLVVFKFKRRKTYARKRGHRERYTRLKVTRIEG
ncbi:MAG: 50S ribosomal protein L21 [Planctomycetes bacterium]|nr:50S ribosomal protein L21 [Planctomycetota bacterium]